MMAAVQNLLHKMTPNYNFIITSRWWIFQRSIFKTVISRIVYNPQQGTLIWLDEQRMRKVWMILHTFMTVVDGEEQ